MKAVQITEAGKVQVADIVKPTLESEKFYLYQICRILWFRP